MRSSSPSPAGERRGGGRERVPHLRRLGLRGGFGRPGQGRVVRQQLLLQRAQLRAGLGAQLVDQHVPDRLVGRQRGGLLAVPVQGQHQQAVQPLAKGLLAGQLAQLGDHLARPAQVQVRVDACLQRLQPQLGQPGPLAGGERVRGHPGQRLAPPQRQRRVQLRSRVRPAARPGGGLPGRHARREPGHVHRLRRGPEQVSLRQRDQGGGAVAEGAAQPHHGVLQAQPDGGRRCLRPQQVGQLVGRNGTARAEQQRRQQHPLLAGRHPHLRAALPHDQRP